MRAIELFRNLSIRCKLLLSYFGLFSLALVAGSEIIYSRVHESMAGGLSAAQIAADPTIEGPLQEIRRVVLTTELATLALVLVLTFAVSALIARPLRGLTRHFEAAAAGDLSAGLARPGERRPAWMESGDEIGALAKAYGLMQRNLLSIVASARTIIEGDLSHPVEERGDLAEAYNQMLAHLRQMVGQTREAATQIDAAVEQMSAASGEQTSSATHQSASISQVTATMSQLARTSTQVTESSERVVEIAARSQEDARGGVEAARAALTAMDAIKETHETSTRGIVSLSEKVQQINEVMDIIDDIADNTKLIAFNAALEAAGAGETGRRFGVVAQEIRRLADTVVEATEDSRNRIVEIQEATENMVVAAERNSRVFEEGFGATQATAESLNKILDSASNTADSARHISMSTQQERTALQQVLEAMTEVSEGASVFANRARESDRITADLKDLAAELTDLIGKYTVDGDWGGRAAAAGARSGEGAA